MEEKLREYAHLIVSVGLNLQKGQTLILSSPVECAPFARLCASAAYDLGAGEVVLNWTDDYITRERFLRAQDAAFETPRPWRRAFFTDYANEGAAYLRIDAEDPETLLGVSPARLVAAQRTSSAERETFDRLQMANGFPWCVAGAPIAAWARKVFPDRSEGDAVAALWDAILKTVRVTGDGNAEARWREHIALLTARKEKLDALRSNIHVLEYENLHNYLVSGDISVAYTFTPFVALALDANPDLKVVWPEEGLGFGIDGCFIPVNAPHAKNANLFLQYLLRPEVAATCAEWQYYCSPNEAAKACLSESYLNNPVFNGIYDRIDDTEYVRNLSSEDEQKYQDIWTTFKLSMQ